MTATTDCEVLLVGAGPVGLLTTLFLAKAGIKTILIEGLPEVDDSPRAMAYGAPAVVELERAGIAAEARKVGMEPSDFNFQLRWITIDNKVVSEFQPEDRIPGSYDGVLCGQYQLAKIMQRRIDEYGTSKVGILGVRAKMNFFPYAVQLIRRLLFTWCIPDTFQP